MELNPNTLSHQSLYKILTGAILPRPIGWISTLSADGVPNLAPFSFFNVVCSAPPTVLFCASIRNSDGGKKDTFHNVKATGEFVVNIVTEELLEAMNLTSIEAPPEFNEMEFAKLTPAPSLTVKPPRVKESPIHFECRLNQIIEISDKPGGGAIVIGTVTHIHAEDRVMVGQDKINLKELKPVGRLMASGYVRVTDIIELERPKNIIQGKS